MSEIETTVTESAPTSTAEVAESVIDAFESTDTTGVEVSGDALPEAAADATATVEAKAAPETPKELSEVESLLQEAGFKDERRPDGRENRIPYSKVKRIIENGLKKGRGEWDTTRTTLERERDEHRGYVEQFRTAVQGDPKAFLSELAQIDQRYQAFLEPQAAAASPQAATEMPAPDVSLPDGSKTYSVEGLQGLIQWAVDAKMMPKVNERIKPYAEREKQAKEQEQQQRAFQEVSTRARQQMETAKSWQNWAEYEGDVLAKLQADTQQAKAAGKRPTMTLKEAYLEVKAERLTTDHNKVRDKVIKELQGTAKSTSVTRQATDAPRPGAAVTTQSVAARTLERLERGA